MKPFYTKTCTNCCGSGKQLEEDRIRGDVWWDTCRVCNGTGQEPVYSKEDYERIEREKRKSRLLLRKNYLDDKISRIVKELSEAQTEMSILVNQLNALDR